MLLDAELAPLYSVTTKRLNEQVKRNAGRFPKNFMSPLTPAEVASMNRSQNATGSQKHRAPQYLPYAFTEHGAIMAATILNSPRAVDMSVYVVRAFVRLRETLASNSELTRQFAQLESRLDKRLLEHGDAIAEILSAIHRLINPRVFKPRPIGFTANLDDTK